MKDLIRAWPYLQSEDTTFKPKETKFQENKQREVIPHFSGLGKEVHRVDHHRKLHREICESIHQSLVLSRRLTEFYDLMFQKGDVFGRISLCFVSRPKTSGKSIFKPQFSNPIQTKPYIQNLITITSVTFLFQIHQFSLFIKKIILTQTASLCSLYIHSFIHQCIRVIGSQAWGNIGITLQCQINSKVLPSSQVLKPWVEQEVGIK